MRSDLLPGFPVIVEQTVAWGEMDAFGHVNNIVYFRYFENARIAYLQRIDWWQQLSTTGIGPIVASIQARFRRPVTHPDQLFVGARVIQISEDRFTMEHRIASEARGEWVTEGSSVVVAYDYRGRQKTAIPDEVRLQIAELEQWRKPGAENFSGPGSKPT